MKLKTKLWSHQREMSDAMTKYTTGWDEINNRGYHGVGIWAGMGTGKTLATIEYLMSHGYRRILIACPKAVIPVWPSEFRKHVEDGPRILAPTKGTCAKKAEELRKSEQIPSTLIFVCNYEAVWRKPLAEVVNSIRWDCIVADEIHRIKSPAGKASRFLSNLKRKVFTTWQHWPRRVGLSGTPMPHSPLDAYAIYRFLDGRVFPRTVVEFKRAYAQMGGFEMREVKRWINQEDFARRFNSISITVNTEDVLDLPPASDHWLWDNLEPKARKVYKSLESELVAPLGDMAEKTLMGAFMGSDVDGAVCSAANAMVLGLRLQQLTGGYAVDEDGEMHKVSEAKRKLLAEWLMDLPQEEPVVIFCRFRPELQAVHEVAKALDRPSVELSGKANQLATWQRHDGPPILAVQIQAGGIGVDLTRARYACYWSTGWSLGDYLQSRARLHRPGQTRSVFYYHLGIISSIDEIIQKALANREELVNNFRTE